MRRLVSWLDPPQWLLLALVSVVVLHLLLPTARVVPRSCFWGCASLAVLGFVLAQVAARQMVRAAMSTEFGATPASLLSEGCFAFSRNPMYLGMLLLLIGEAAMLGTVGALLPVPVFFLGLQLRYVPDEEQRLQEAFGASWVEYSRRVRRWI